MKSFTSRRFREMYANLPKRGSIEGRSRVRPLQAQSPPPDYRALGQIDGDDIVWFWIGSHAEYDKLL